MMHISSRVWNKAAVAACFIFQSILCSSIYASDALPDRPVNAYVVVVSSETFEDPEWQEVAKKLVKKYNAGILKWNEDVEEVKDGLAEVMPKYTAFLARPEEAGHDFVVKISRMCRALDDDPYVDTLWGIVTGYNAADALRIVSMEEPLIVTRVLDATGKLDLNKFDQGVSFDTYDRGFMMEKLPGRSAVKRACENDDTGEFLAAIDNIKPQLIATASHATEHDWDMGYESPDMTMGHEDGQLFCVDTDENQYDLNSDEPKIYIGAGNCLIGDIDKADCMATSWMHSGGACQFIGYTVSTWFGEMGWGTLDKFASQGGVYTAAEAFHFNNTELIRTIQDEYPQHVRTNLKNYEDIDTDDDKIYKALKIKKTDPDAEALVGRLYDRDVVAFFGDPAFEVRVKPSVIVSTEKLHDGKFAGSLQIRIDAVADGAWSDSGETYFALPFSMKNIKCVDTNIDENIDCADNFILVALNGKYKKGDSFRIVLKESP